MRRTMIVLGVLAALLFSAGGVAWAKEPDSAVLTGPGLGGGVKIRPDSEANSAGLDLLRQASGIGAVLVAELPGAPQADRPVGELGPAYRLVWHIPGEERTEVVQEVYPYAEPEPWVHTPAQPLVVRHGWSQAHSFLKDTLITFGLPENAPAPGVSWWNMAWVAVLVVVVTFLVVMFARRRRAVLPYSSDDHR
ncbi:hypothetical protein [Streptosporangium sp. CA-115845]|uniref:hypothetical protein n=1 Tax=Streptosporangium sp. CA-115845 TaxID=3240071 RepID=UPI003D8E2F3C